MATIQKTITPRYLYGAYGNSGTGMNTNITLSSLPAMVHTHPVGAAASGYLIIEFNDKELFKATKIKTATMSVAVSETDLANPTASKMGLRVKPILDGYAAGSSTINNPHTSTSNTTGTFSGNTFTFDLTKLGNDAALVANGLWFEAASPNQVAALYVNSVKIDLTYETTNPVAISPLGGYVDPRKAITFRWSFANQSRAQLRLVYNSQMYRYDMTGTRQSYTLPANSIPVNLSAVDWNVACFDNNNISGVNALTRFSTNDPTPLAPTLIRPKNMDIDSAQVTVFRWQHNSPIGSAQTKVEIRWATDNKGTAWKVVTATGNVREYAFFSGTFPNGEIYWQVRTFNTENEASPWSALARFYSLAPPREPQILSITQESARPTIEWAAEIQAAYELRVLDIDGIVIYSTGKVSGEEKKHKITDFLDDGQYSVEIRVFNANDLSSQWVSAPFLVDTVKPVPFVLSCAATVSSLCIDLGDAVESGTRAILYRRTENEPWLAVAVLDEGEREYHDYRVASGVEYTYKARCLDVLEAFSDSEAAAMVWNARRLHIGMADDPAQEIRLRWHLDSLQYPQESPTFGATQKHYLGRELPVVVFDGFMEKSVSMNYLIRLNEMERDALIAMAQRRAPLLVRDVWGRKNYGVILNPAMTQNHHGAETSFTLTCIDYREGVEV